MIALYVQTVVLLAIAYVLGAAVAYVIRRSLFRPAVPLPVAERRVDPLPEFANTSTRAAAPAPPVVVPKPAPVAGPAQDLRNIRLIDEATESLLKRHGVSRYEQIAEWTAADVARIGQVLSSKRRISQENWIEQAQVLAKGGETEFARRRARGELASAVPSPDAARNTSGLTPTVAPALAMRPQPSTAGAAAVVAQIITAPMPAAAAPAPRPEPAAAVPPANVAERAAFAIETPRVAMPIRPQAPAAQDNFMRIGNIDTAAAEVLAAHGVVRYAHIAQWTPAAVEKFDKLLGGATGRISRENWIEQAQILSRGGDTAFSRRYDRQHGSVSPSVHPANLADAIRDNAARGTATVPAMAQAERRDAGPAAARPRVHENGGSEPAPAATLLRPTATQDLKRIRGIGVLIEKKLNSMGIANYETIANWSAADIDRVSQTLDFKGRIERENWIEQARILASGGATEFSRRVDKGEVETSRARP